MISLIKSIMWLILLAAINPISSFSQEEVNSDLTPITNDGQKWRIAYYEGGAYSEYQKYFTASIQGLMELGWIETVDIPPPQGEQTGDLWNWLRVNAKSDYIEFVESAHYSANWDDALRPQIASTIIERLKQQNDIDLIIAMGTWAGQDLANNKHNIPTLVLSSSDPIGAGIIKSATDSGFDHIHAHAAPERIKRQIHLFYDAVEFSKLGIAYEDSVAGRSYAGITDVEKVAQERGFEVVSCYTKTDVPNTEDAEHSVIACFHSLAEKADAIYVIAQQGVTARSLPTLIRIANSKKIPTFSQIGIQEVEQGLLLSMVTAYQETGRFIASNIAKILKGAKPGELDQIFEDPPRLALNLASAERIGYNPPLIVLGAVDKFYRKIPDQH